MKIVKPNVEFFGAVPTDYENALRFIELAGRTCYKSEDKITPTSAESFVKRLTKADHLAMVEHSNFVVRTGYYKNRSRLPTHVSKYALGPYLSVQGVRDYVYVGGNLNWRKRNDKTRSMVRDFQICDRIRAGYSISRSSSKPLSRSVREPMEGSPGNYYCLGELPPVESAGTEVRGEAAFAR